MFEIRPALKADFSAIGDIFHDAVHQVARGHYTQEQLRAWSPGPFDAAHWQRRAAQLEMRVAVLDRTPAGFIGFSRVGYVDLLFVRPEFVRRGFGRKLLVEAERFLAQSNVKIAWTDASATARSFFEAIGYTIVREQTARCGDTELHNYRMEKILPQTDGAPLRINSTER